MLELLLKNHINHELYPLYWQIKEIGKSKSSFDKSCSKIQLKSSALASNNHSERQKSFGDYSDQQRERSSQFPYYIIIIIITRHHPPQSVTNRNDKTLTIIQGIALISQGLNRLFVKSTRLHSAFLLVPIPSVYFATILLYVCYTICILPHFMRIGRIQRFRD